MKQLPSRTAKAKELLTGIKQKPVYKIKPTSNVSKSTSILDKIFKQIEENEIKPYVHDGWTLYTRLVKLHDGTEQRIYFFSKRLVNNGTPCAIPEGFDIGINERIRLPYLKKVKVGEIE